MSFELRLNLDRISETAKEAFAETALLFERELTQVMSEPGAFPSHPDSDIVDTGQLRASQTVNKVSDFQSDFSYPTEYALYVHEGYTMKNGRVIIGRPWTEKAAENLNVEAVFNQAFEELQ
jgi:hypothetical protein